MSVYKIRSKKTGLYSQGGAGPIGWSKVGKAWSSLAALKSHLTLYRGELSGRSRKIPNDWEVVVFVEGSTIDADKLE